MSDNWLQFVPVNPKYQPSRQAAEKAKLLLATFVPRAKEVNVEFTDNIRFFNPCGNWSGVNCPACGQNANAWWGNAMDQAFHGQFTELEVKTPCCGATVSLNEMDYIWPAAFGSFVLEAMNPNVTDLTAVQEQQLAFCLGCKLLKVWVHI